MSSTGIANPGLTTTKARNPAPKWDVQKIIPVLFNRVPDQGTHFYPLLLQEEVYEVKDLFDIGTLGPAGIVNMFGGQASTFRVHLAIIITFAEFIKKHVGGVVDLGSDPDKVINSER